MAEKFKTSAYVQTLENTVGIECFKHHTRVQNKIKKKKLLQIK